MSELQHDRRGSIGVIVAIVLLALGLAGAAGFGIWAYLERTDYKDNVDKKVAEAVQKNTKKVQAEEAVKFAEEAKKPLKPFTGPAEFGSVKLMYPKNWSLYSAGAGASPVNLYVHPDFVPIATGQSSVFALRIQVLEQNYDSVLQTYSGLQKQNKVTVRPFALAKNQANKGSRIDGQIAMGREGSVVLVPMRDKTFKIWTESNSNKADFDNIILPNVSFTP